MHTFQKDRFWKDSKINLKGSLYFVNSEILVF